MSLRDRFKNARELSSARGRGILPDQSGNRNIFPDQSGNRNIFPTPPRREPGAIGFGESLRNTFSRNEQPRSFGEAPMSRVRQNAGEAPMSRVRQNAGEAPMSRVRQNAGEAPMSRVRQNAALMQGPLDTRGIQKTQNQNTPPVNTGVMKGPQNQNRPSLFSTQTQDVEQPETDSKFINPATGEKFSPEEYADNYVNKFSGGGQGDIGRLSAEAMGLNNYRNDIASGEVDPFGVGKDSGIAYTASELKAIENAQAGIYDPALQNVFSRLETARAQQAEESQIAQEQREFDRNLQGEKDLIELAGNASGSSFNEISEQAKTIATGVRNGDFKISDIKDESLKNQVILQLSQNPAMDPATSNLLRGASTVVRDANSALEFINNASSFDADKTGVISANLRSFNSNVAGTDEFEIAKLIQSVKDNIGIDALLNIKREGSGLGQVPQRQLESLQGLLGRLEVSRDPTMLRREINDVLGIYQDIVDSNGGSILRSDGASQTNQAGSNQNETIQDSDIESFIEQFGYDPRESQSENFNTVGNTRDSRGLINRASADTFSENNPGEFNPNISFASKAIALSSPLANAMQAIANLESRGSGGYSAKGPMVKSGMYKGERALGRYQVMPGNLPQWSKEALNRNVSPEEFLNNPEIQDVIVAVQFLKNMEKFGNWDDAASVWFTGRPVKTGGKARDSLGTSGNEYVDKFNKELRNIG